MPVMLAAVSLLLHLPMVRGQVLLDDNFADGERVTQNLPTSAHWYSGGASNKVSVTNGVLVFRGDSATGTPGSIHGGGLAYFTVAGSPVSLAVGQSMTLSFIYSYGQNDSTDWSFGFGLYNSGGSRVAVDNTSFNNSIFSGYTGFEAAGILGVDSSGTGRYKIAERNLAANNLLATTSYTILGANIKQTVATNAGTTYNASLTLTYVSATNMTLTSVLAGQTVVRTNTVGLVTSFDTVGIFAPNTPGSLTIDDVLITVTQGGQAIAFATLPDQTYGNAPFGLSASASSGLPVQFNIVSGPASVSGSNVTILGAGVVTVQASQPGNVIYPPAAPVLQSFTVAPAVLTVTADNKTRILGAPNPALSASYTGFVNGDGSNVLSGSPTLSTAATTTSSVAGSPYSILVTSGTLSATNYTFGFVSGQLTVTPAESAMAVSSSANPSPTGAKLTFTATLEAVAPGSGTPTGVVQFLADNAALGLPVALAGGVAKLTTTALSHGTHAITALYAGDGNFLGATNSLSPNQIIDTPPVAVNATIYRNALTGTKVLLSTLLASDSDADGDTLTATVSTASASNGIVSLGGRWVFYTPPAGFTNADSFTYAIADGFGGSATATVTVAIQTDNKQPSQNLVITPLGSSQFRIEGSGIPTYPYRLQYSDSASPYNWQTFAGLSLVANGLGDFKYTNTVAGPTRYYRSLYP